MTDAPSHTDLPACPPWCKSPAGHPYTDEAVDGSYEARYHEDAERLGEVAPLARSMSYSGLAGSSIDATITCEEQAVTGGGVVQWEPRITLWAENPVLTAEEARAVAALLLRAADRLDALTDSD